MSRRRHLPEPEIEDFKRQCFGSTTFGQKTFHESYLVERQEENTQTSRHLVDKDTAQKRLVNKCMAIGGDTVVEQLSHDPKFNGSNPAYAGAGRKYPKHLVILLVWDIFFLRQHRLDSNS